jgi:uncharacterized protein (TIGR03437 family)
LILKAGQFPDLPCGADGTNCPKTNQGDLNCQATPAVCAAEDTTGANIDAAFNFWSAFAKKHAADPAILYDTWEDMHAIDGNTWSDDQNQLIAAIRTYSPQSVIFMEDTGTAFESIMQGALPDLGWSNIVWNFHLYNGPSGNCTNPASTRYANWPQNFDPLVSYAHQYGHAVAITEWGGCNDGDPYHANITSYAQTHSVSLAYFDSTNLITQSGASYQLTATGTKVAQAYTAIAAGGPGTVASANSASGTTTLAAEAIASAYGANLATVTQSASVVPLPINLGGTTVTVSDSNGISRSAELFFVSTAQVNYEVPPGVASGNATVTVSVNGNPVATGTAQIAVLSPGIFTANASGQGVAAAIAVTIHADGSSGYVFTFQPSNAAAIPIDLGLDTDQVVLELYGTGIRGHSGTVSCKIGSITLPVAYAGPQGLYVGEDQVNILLPKSLRGAGLLPVVLTVDGQTANTVSVSFK